MAEIRKEIPSATAKPDDEIADILCSASIADSKTEARRLIQDNAIAINNQKTQAQRLADEHFQNGRLLIRKGKAFKDSALVERSA
jgi:tyrosyl-tRNA synthetase